MDRQESLSRLCCCCDFSAGVGDGAVGQHRSADEIFWCCEFNPVDEGESVVRQGVNGVCCCCGFGAGGGGGTVCREDSVYRLCCCWESSPGSKGGGVDCQDSLGSVCFCCKCDARGEVGTVDRQEGVGELWFCDVLVSGGVGLGVFCFFEALTRGGSGSDAGDGEVFTMSVIFSRMGARRSFSIVMKCS